MTLLKVISPVIKVEGKTYPGITPLHKKLISLSTTLIDQQHHRRCLHQNSKIEAEKQS